MRLKGELEKGGKDMIDMTNFKKSVKWYDENLATLLPQYRGKYVGVCIDKVCGSEASTSRSSSKGM